MFFFHALGLVSGALGQVLHDFRNALGGVGLLAHNHAAHGDIAGVLRAAEYIQKELFLLVEVVAYHLFQREKPVEGDTAWDFLHKVALGLFGGYD